MAGAYPFGHRGGRGHGGGRGRGGGRGHGRKPRTRIVNNNNKSSIQANGYASGATLRENGLSNGYRGTHEPERNFRPLNNRPEEKSSRYEERQQFDQRQHDNFRQNNRSRNHGTYFSRNDDGKNKRSNFGTDRSRPRNSKPNLGPSNQKPAPVPAAKVFPKLLPAEVFTKVSMRHKETTYMAVTPVSSLPELEQLSASIQVAAATAAPLTPALTKCLVHSQTYSRWCRGKVMQVEPLMVKLVDYGSMEICKPEQLRQITPQFSSIMPFVVYIKPNLGTVEELSKKSVFSVKPLKKDESYCWIVEVDSSEVTEESRAVSISSGTGPSTQSSSPVPAASAKEPPTKLPSPAQTVVPTQLPSPAQQDRPAFLNRDQFTTVIITYLDEENPEGNTFFVGTTTTLLMILGMMNHFEFQKPNEVLESPQIGDLGLALYDTEWYRVKVVGVSPLRVFYIDFGNTETRSPEDLKVCPARLKDIYHLVHKVRLAPGTDVQHYNLSSMSEISIKPVSEAADGVTVVQIEDETYSEPVTAAVAASSQGIETRLIQNSPVAPVSVVAAECPRCGYSSATAEQ